MSIVVVGINHKTAPVEIREQLAFAESRLPEALRTLADGQTISEAVIVSTCNRVELIAAAKSQTDGDQLISHLREFLRAFHGCESATLTNHCYGHADLSAISHIFRVTSSLDSMVVGEPQITGQVKDAFQLAQEHGSVGHTLTRLMNRAFSVAKRVRNETGIGSNAVSISFVAVELARKVFETLNGSTVMLIGAGEMAELAAKHLLNCGASKVLIANRTYENAVRLAEELHGEAVRFEDFERRMAEAEVVICSTGSPNYLLHPAQVKRALAARHNRPMLIVDISVPRNVDPAINQLDNAFVFDVDDLQSIAESNLAERQREAQRAEIIIAEESQRFIEVLAEGDINTVIGNFRQQAGALAFAELERSRKRLGDLSEQQEEALRVMLNAIVNKFTQPVIKQLRESENGHSPYLSVWREMYHHHDENKK